ncbi:MAG: putative polynucleotide kinase [Caudoviricetes sp.]|nr:MAG: putative polynucleotide kinase [Caudoviricetes sp.]
MIMRAWDRNKDIVVSDTNLNKGRREALIENLKSLGYIIEIVPFHITREEAVKRDNLRANGVGESVIYRQHLDMLDFTERKTYTPDETKQPTIIVDVDGTVAEMHDRGPFDWKKVGQDKPRWFVIDMVINYQRQGYEIIIVSGRSDECKQATFNWLEKHGVPFSELHMRKAGDYRKDDAVKEEIFWTHLADRYNIVACIDDRPQMIRLWHEIKIPNVIAVANPYLEF